ncbi:MAG: hypothetical protein M1118_10025 [Chloroflexi bacterium]|nr:hypothetical protein [Chloroflexota bacterium]
MAEPTSGTQVRQFGSLYIVTETAGDSPAERQMCRVAAEWIRKEFYQQPNPDLSTALFSAIERAHGQTRLDPRLPPISERLPLAITIIAIRNGEMMCAHLLPVQVYVGAFDDIAYIPDPPLPESQEKFATRHLEFGISESIEPELRTARLEQGNVIAVCSYALAQSLDTAHITGVTRSSDLEAARRILRSSFPYPDVAAYALLIRIETDGRLGAAANERPDKLLSQVLAKASIRLGSVFQRGPRARSARASTRASRSRRRDDGTVLLIGLAVAAVVAVALLAVLMLKGIQAFQAHQQQTALAQTVAQVNQLVQKANTEKDPAAALTDLANAATVVRRSESHLPPGAAQNILTTLQKARDHIGRGATLQNLKPLLNLSAPTTSTKVHFNQVVVAGGVPYILDTGGQRVIEVSTSKRIAVPRIAAGQQVGQTIVQSIVAIAAEGSNVLAVDNHNVVWRYSSATNQVQQVLVPGSDAWGNVQAITVSHGNLYVLDTRLSRVWVYPPQGSGYGPPVDFFGSLAAQVPTPQPTATPPPRPTPTAAPIPSPTPFTPPDLHHSSDIAFDGSLYILQSDGKILKYTKGVRVPFPETGLVGSLPNVSRLIVPSESAGVFVVDPAGDRIVHFTASGQYDRQYFLPDNTNAGLSTLVDAALDPQAQTVYLLSDAVLAVATLPNP